MPQQWTFPSLECRFQEPDILHIKVTAAKEIELESVKGLYGISLSEKPQHLYCVVDLGTGAIPSREAREAMPHLQNGNDPMAMVLYGGTMTSRAVIMLLLRGLTLLRFLRTEATTVKTQSEALDWVSKHRANREAKAK